MYACRCSYLPTSFVLIMKLLFLQNLERLSVSNVRTMKLNDDVLKIALSPDAKYIAVALLDCTVKVSDSFICLHL